MRLHITGLCIAAVAALVPGIGAIAETQLTPTISVSETYSDNVDQNPSGAETSAFISEVSPGLNLRWKASRITAAADAAATFQHQTAGEDKGVQVLPELGGFGTAELSRDLFFVDASASVSQQLFNTRQSNTSANRDTVQNYSVSPYLVNRFGGFATGELRYTFKQVLTSGGNAQGPGIGSASNLSDARTHSVSTSLNSGDDFARFHWSLSGSASESFVTGDANVTRRDAALNLEYPVVRWLSVLGGAGYQKLDDGDPADKVDGPTWNAGVLLQPGPRTDLRATYGERDGGTSLDATFTYRISPRTTVTASYNERLETGQERVLQDLSFIATDPNTGALIDSRTGLPFNPNTSKTGLQDNTTRTKRLTVSLHGTRGRNSFQAQGVVEKSREEGSNPSNGNEDAYSLSASFDRRLTPDLSLSVSASYSRDEFSLNNRTDNDFGAGGSFSYAVFSNVDAFASYSFEKQISTDSTEEFLENRVSIGVRMSF